MISNWLQYLFLLSFSLLISACGDRQLLDKTVQNSSILRGEKVSEKSPAFQRTVLLVQHLEMTDEIPTLFGLCSGLVLNSRTVLTAAHCLQNGREEMKVILKPDPKAGLNPTDDVFSVVDSRQHPNADLAVLYLDRNLPIESEIKSLSEDNSLTTKMLITGYGRTTELKDTTGISFYEINGYLNQAWIDISNSNLSGSSFSVKQTNSGGVCFGDSGGPAFVKNNNGYQAVAIAVGVSKGSKKENVCQGSGLYLNIKFYQDWIDQNQLDLQNTNN